MLSTPTKAPVSHLLREVQYETKPYEVDPLICPRCGFPLRVLSCIEDPPVVRRILDHLGLWDTQHRPPPAQPIATELIGGVLPWVAEDPYPYDQTGWASDEPA